MLDKIKRNHKDFDDNIRLLHIEKFGHVSLKDDALQAHQDRAELLRWATEAKNLFYELADKVNPIQSKEIYKLLKKLESEAGGMSIKRLIDVCHYLQTAVCFNGKYFCKKHETVCQNMKRCPDYKPREDGR